MTTKTEVKHTPEPQIREFHAVDDDFCLVNRKDGSLFAKTWSIHDARLIAAAPELLEACKMALEELAHYWGPKDILKRREQLQAAIAKAEGGN